MHSICENIQEIKRETGKVDLVVVSKFRSIPELDEVYVCGQRDFGENRVQEMLSKAEELPKDIRWHLIGHLQSNKVKYIAPFVHLIHSVDSLKLLAAINKEAKKYGRIIDFLFQVHIAEEESKFGLNANELLDTIRSEIFLEMGHVRCRGLMGMATLTEDREKVRSEFSGLRNLFEKVKNTLAVDILSMGMSSDYLIAVEEGSTMLRIGSKVFEK